MVTPLVTTHHAPAERASEGELRAARKAFFANPFAVTMLNAIPDFAVVIDKHRQIIAANNSFLRALEIDNVEPLIGLRPGESVGCVYAEEAPGGCGTGRYCIHCGGVESMVECFHTRGSVTRECRVVTCGDIDGGALTLEVKATFLPCENHELAVLVMKDISAEKRRRLLERVFFHDVLNTASSIRTISDLMLEVDGTDETDRLRQTLGRLSRRIIEEISSQRQLLAAEQGELKLDLAEVQVADILFDVCAFFQHEEQTQQCTLVLGEQPDCAIVTDAILLHRVLGNLVKNAMEAARPGEAVTLSASEDDESVTFSVHNPGVMPEDVQRQIFQRSFSTKGSKGRGVGTYSVKLFTERYLGGTVRFISHEDDGTVFLVTLQKGRFTLDE